MPDPTGLREQLRGQVRAELARARPRLMDAARAADEAADGDLHRRVLALVAGVDDVLDEVDPTR